MGLDRNWRVLVRGGTYPQPGTLVFGPEDSGTERYSITYAAAPGEKVVLDGGRRITDWKKGEGEIWRAELPEVKTGKWYFRQLYDLTLWPPSPPKSLTAAPITTPASANAWTANPKSEV